MAEVLSLPLTSSELLPKLLSALYSGLSLEDLSQLFFLFFVFFVSVCAIFSGYITAVGEKKKIKVPRGRPQNTV